MIMHGRKLTTHFTSCMVLLYSLNTIQCGLLGNKRIQDLLKRTVTTIRTRDTTTSTRPAEPAKPAKPTDAKETKFNGSLAYNNADDVRYLVEKPIDFGECHHSSVFSTDTLMDECYYLRCDIASGKYVRRKCPSGMSVPNYYMRENNGKRKKTEVSHLPCIMPSSKCRPHLVQQGVERPVVLACGIDIVFAVDVSCSINDANKIQIQNFLMSIADVIAIGPISTRIGIVSFSKQIFHVTFLNETQNKFQYKRTVKQMNLVLENERIIRRDCGTSTNVALESVRLDYFTTLGGDRPDKPNVLFVLSDGLTVPSENKNLTLAEAKKLKKLEIPTYVMGLPNQRQIELGKRNVYIGDEEWNAIASEPENVFKMEFDTLTQKIAFLASQVCTVQN